MTTETHALSSPSNTTNSDALTTATLTIITRRGQPLTATCYRPQTAMLATPMDNDAKNINIPIESISSTKSDQINRINPINQVTTAVMIAPATGIKRQFYHKFATYLATQGIGVITYDNEGIGDSLNGPLARCDASLISWGRDDMPAILEALQDEFADASYHLIGHSAGGQLIGLMENYAALDSVFNVACSSGRIKNMTQPFKLKAQIFMDGAITLSNLFLGYTPADKFGMSEPLPSGVAAQWRDWCNGKGYVKTAFGKTIFTHHYDDITAPSLWLNFTDDDIANAKNVDDMLQVFTNMPAERKMLKPSEVGLKHIGHMAYFSGKTLKAAPQLWQMAAEWLQQHSNRGNKTD